MNLSETTLILPREPDLEATDGKGVRIFTTREELPFAGHPTIGTALYLYLYSTAETAPGEIILGGGGLCSPKSRKFPGSDQLNRLRFRSNSSQTDRDRGIKVSQDFQTPGRRTCRRYLKMGVPSRAFVPAMETSKEGTLNYLDTEVRKNSS